MPGFLQWFQYPTLQEPVLTASQRPEAVMESKFHQPWSEPVRLRTITVALIAASGVAWNPFIPPNEVVTLDKWYQRYSEPVRNKLGLLASNQQALALYPFPIPNPIVYSWLYGWSEPVRNKPRLIEAGQPFFAFSPNPIVNFGWPQWLSEPVRAKPRLITAAQREFTINPTPIINVAWFNWLSEPVRKKPALANNLQQVLAYQPTPIITVPWFNWLNEPVRNKPGTPSTVQPFFQFHPTPVVSFSWFNWYSEPVRVKPSLLVANQETQPLRPFTPLVYTVSVNTTESRDRFLGELRTYNAVSIAYVDIHEFWLKQGGLDNAYESLVEIASISAILSVNVEESTASSGTPVTSTLRAYVTIVET